MLYLVLLQCKVLANFHSQVVRQIILCWFSDSHPSAAATGSSVVGGGHSFSEIAKEHFAAETA